MALLSIERYRTLTHDSVTADGDVSDAIDEAENTLAEELRRPLEVAERTEIVEIDSNGYAYPLAKPLISVDDDYEFDETSVTINSVIAFGDLPIELVNSGSQRTTTITYTGGWTDETMPTTIARAIAEIAFNMTRPIPSLAGEYQNATSIRNGDVALGFKDGIGAGSATGEVAGDAVKKAVRRYGRRPV